VDVQAPDFETRVAILKKKVETNNIYISDDVIEYVATNVTNNIRNLEAALIKLLAFAGLTGSEIIRHGLRSTLLRVPDVSGPEAATIADAMHVFASDFASRSISSESNRRTVWPPGGHVSRQGKGRRLPSADRPRVRQPRHTPSLHACQKIRGLRRGPASATIRTSFARF
jgi:chromosomal replication initiator protein